GGNSMTLQNNSFRPSDVLFHLDTNETLKLTNTVNTGAITNIGGGNGWGNNLIGSIFALDGGTLFLENLTLTGATNQKADMGAINFVGCYNGTDPNNYETGHVDDFHGGTIILKNVTVNGQCGISNYEPPSVTKTNGQESPTNHPTKIVDNSTITIVLSHATFTTSKKKIVLNNITNANIRIVMEHTNNVSFDLSGCEMSNIVFYTDSDNEKNIPKGIPKANMKSIDDYKALNDAVTW
ncbi:MAG: hypothetical protein KBS81_07740, partial [Spirochaetales bacterium]|nr:hypothetical protein [Candidatus Physcosoma equi]